MKNSKAKTAKVDTKSCKSWQKSKENVIDMSNLFLFDLVYI